MKETIEHTTIHLLTLAMARIEEAMEQADPNKMPAVYLSGGGNCITLTPTYVTGPDRADLWVCMLKALKAIGTGETRLCIQRTPSDHESRMTPLCPPEMIDRMIESLQAPTK